MSKIEQPLEEPFDAGNAEHVKAKRDVSKARQRLIDQGLADCMSTKQGRAFLWDLLDFCGIFRSSYTGNNGTFFMEGQRNVGLRMYGPIVKNHPDRYIDMLKEHQT